MATLAGKMWWQIWWRIEEAHRANTDVDVIHQT